MNSNYQWQKLQANDRVKARIREAENQRLIKGEASQGDSFFTSIRNKVRRGIQPAGYRPGRETREIGRQKSSATMG